MLGLRDSQETEGKNVSYQLSTVHLWLAIYERNPKPRPRRILVLRRLLMRVRWPKYYVNYAYRNIVISRTSAGFFRDTYRLVSDKNGIDLHFDVLRLHTPEHYDDVWRQRLKASHREMSSSQLALGIPGSS